MRYPSDNPKDLYCTSMTDQDQIFNEGEDLFLPNSSTELETDINSNGDGDDNNDDDDDDDGNEICLFGGNAYPPVYYRQGYQAFNNEDLAVGDYAPGVEQTLAKIAEHWEQCVSCWSTSLVLPLIDLLTDFAPPFSDRMPNNVSQRCPPRCSIIS